MAIVAFILWIGYGVWQWKRSSALYERLSQIPAKKRMTMATLLLVGSALALVGVIYLVYLSSPKEIPAWGWAVIVVAGLGFVHAQTLAAAMLISTALRKPDP